jgi:hypothetical protein
MTPPIQAETEEAAAAFLLFALDEAKRDTHHQDSAEQSAASTPPASSEPESRWTGKPPLASLFVGNTPGAANSILRNTCAGVSNGRQSVIASSSPGCCDPEDRPGYRLFPLKEK